MSSKSRILIIEDNFQNRYLAAFLLEGAGHEVHQAETGAQGLEMAERIRPDIILLDIQLPEMDGHEVTRLLKAHPGLRATPVVAVTSYAMAGDREKCLTAGAEGYIEKPINPETFVTEVEAYTRSRQGNEGGNVGQGKPGGLK